MLIGFAHCRRLVGLDLPRLRRDSTGQVISSVLGILAGTHSVRLNGHEAGGGAASFFFRSLGFLAVGSGTGAGSGASGGFSSGR